MRGAWSSDLADSLRAAEQETVSSGPCRSSPKTALDSGDGTSAAAARSAARPGPTHPAHRSLDHSTSGTCCSAAAAAAISISGSHRICQGAGARRVPVCIQGAAVAAITASTSASSASATAATADQVTVAPARTPPRTTIGRGAGAGQGRR